MKVALAMTESINSAWNRKTYQQSQVVRNFASWIGSAWDANSLVHKYTIHQNKAEWDCHSLSNAAAKYCWPIARGPSVPTKANSFEANYQELAKWRSELRTSLKQGDAKKCKETCLALMQWGGTTLGNSKWLSEKHKASCLLEYMLFARNTLGRHDLSLDAQDLSRLRSNAGFTKIYSLLVDEFVIYDSRVAAALTWFVAEFCRKSNANVVPAELIFCVMPFKSRKQLRNPSNARYVFPLFSSGTRHLRYNIMANWLFLEILRQPQFAELGSIERTLRSLEAALFMIGYDLAGLKFASRPPSH